MNPRLNALTTACWDRAAVEARAADQAVLDGERLGPLHGLPIGSFLERHLADIPGLGRPLPDLVALAE